MKKQFALLLTSLCLGLSSLHAENITVSFVDAQGASARRDQQSVSDKIVLNGTGAEATFKVKTTGLIQDVSVRATNGFKVEPTTIQAGLDEEITVTVTHLTSMAKHEGKVILRSGDKRAYVQLNGYGTPLEVKDISGEPIYNGGKEGDMTFDAADLKAEKGYTLEIKARTDAAGAMVRPYGLTADGVGFKSYIGNTSMGLYNGANTFISDEAISNPSNGGTFYNTDGLYHTYRYAVTPDKRVFVYRDGIALDTFRLADLALQPEWTVENGDVEKNLLKNGDFEGEWDFSESRNIVTRIEGWDVYPYDQYNSTQEIKAQERDNNVDQNNHVLSMDRYMWNAGWAAGEVSQIVDVAPNEIYSFSALARGGMKDGEALGSLRIYDLQNTDNTVTIPVTGDSYQKYAADFETKANTKQIRVSFYLERASWGASVSSLEVDDAKLTGVKRLPEPKLGFDNLDGDVAYFAYDATGAYAPAFAELGTSVSKLDIDGTGSTGTFKVNAENLTGDISVSATHGFTVSPARIAAGTSEATVTVTHLTSMAKHEGKVILRSGDKRAYVQLNGYGTPLEVKDISGEPIYNGGKEGDMTFDAADLKAEKGYTLEIKARTDAAGAMVRPYGLTADGVGFKSYIGNTSMGLYNGANTFISDEAISNPSNGGTFYNTDGLYHTYRYAVTPDKRVFVYRDGIAVDTFRLADLALQPEWTVENGDVEKNLLKNGDFEGEWDFSESRNIVTRIEGWDVYPYDQYNSTQEIKAQERDNNVDQNNHVLSMDRYMWNAGWAAGEVSQIVDVAPNEIYSFSALARGGMKDGEALGSLRIYDLQNTDNTVTIPVTGDSYQKYAADFETKANTKQIRVSFYLERASWGASVSSLEVDDAKLTGVKRLPEPKLGFDNLDGDVAYFAYDATGAYAPAFAELGTSVSKLDIDGTGSTGTFKVNAENLTGDISVSATHGFTVSPARIAAGTSEATVTVTHLTSMAKHEGKVILRSGDKRAYVQLNGYGTPLEVKDISGEPIYNGGKEGDMTFDAADLKAEKGYTLEIKARTDAAGAMVRPYGLTADGVGFKSYIGNTSMGLYNGANTFISDEAISNPSNGGTFYNTDGLYHTYRYAVTPDKRVFVYRDGIAVDTFRLADLALQPEWTVENGDVEKNLLKNGDFEGEWDFSESRNIVTRIEGWDVYPYDQYNSTQEIKAQERDNNVDQNNHVLSMDRYMWNAGWAAGEVSQIVDVAPNEIYSFSALARGGMKDGEALGSLRIYDLQNTDNTVTIPVTGDSYQKYAADFETKANTKQIRVSFYLERASWGASVSSLEVDDAKLTGVKRLPEPKLGFDNLDGDVAYFAYDATGAYAPAFAELGTSVSKLDIDGTGSTGTFKVNAENLTGDISVSATHGFTVSPARIAAGTSEATVTVTHLTSMAKHEGKVILRSGDKRAYVQLNGYGTPLEVKDISGEPIYNGGKEGDMTFDAADLKAEKGYTLEIKARTDAAGAMVRPYGLTADGVGFKSYIGNTSMGLYNGANTFISDEAISNPSNGGTFYNTDGLYHTYRYAVTPDKRVFVYRDGIAVDTFRLADLALQPEWTVENGDVEKNLLKNGDFEGEWDFSESRNIVTRIEGWDVYPYDQYNSTQEIKAQERDNNVDQNNHVLSMDRYMWNAGWAAGEVSQIVDVAPNEIYSFSALARGGMKDGEALGSLRIYDLQNTDNTVTIPVTGDSYQKYAADFETKANTKQIRVSFYLERASWGASVSSLEVDDAKLTGVKRLPEPKLGFDNLDGDVAYFAYDATGAYAPMMPGLTISEIQTAIEHATISDGKVTARVEDGMLILNGVHDGSMVLIYNKAGNMIAHYSEYIDGMGIALPERGIYIVAVIYENDKHVVKVVY